MERKTWVILVVVVVFVIAVAAYGGYGRWSEGQYTQVAMAVCDQMTNTSSAFATYVATANDFDALKRKAEECQRDTRTLLVSLNATGNRGVPDRFVPFHKGLQATLNSYDSFYTKVATEAGGWSKSSFEGVETARSAVLQNASTCFVSWPTAISPIKNDTAWCGSLASDLKKLADSKKSVPSGTTSAVLVAGGIPGSGGVLVSLPSTGGQFYYNPAAGYVSEMRSLLNGYKSLRGDLDRAVQTYDNGGGISYGTLDNAIQSRRNILSAIQGLSPSSEYAGAHQLAIRTLSTGIDAVTAFRNSPASGGRQALHELSQTNNNNMEQLKGIYGF